MIGALKARLAQAVRQLDTATADQRERAVLEFVVMVAGGGIGHNSSAQLAPFAPHPAPRVHI